MLVLDAGAFIAAERGSKYVAALVKRERERGRVPVTNGSVVAQSGGGSGKQAPVARLLASVEDFPSMTISADVRDCCWPSGTSDVVDASVICLAQAGTTSH